MSQKRKADKDGKRPIRRRADSGANAESLLSKLGEKLKSDMKKVKSDKCNEEAVCWNFTFLGGGKDKAAKQPGEYYDAILGTENCPYALNPQRMPIIEKESRLKEGIKNARKLVLKEDGKTRKRPKKQSNIKDAQKTMLEVTCQGMGLTLAPGSNLMVRAYHPTKQSEDWLRCPNHFELVYRDDANENPITLTKGINEKVYAVRGETAMDYEADVVDVEIDPKSLSEAHKSVLADMLNNDAEDAGSESSN